LLLIVFGVTVFRSPRAMVGGNEMSFPRALFTSVNAATLTGFPQTVAIDQYQLLGQGAVFALVLAGTYSSLTAGGLAVVRIVGLPYSAARVCAFAAGAQFAAIFGGGTLLLEPSRPYFAAWFTAASAFGNAGFMLGAPLVGSDARSLLIALPLSALGGFGLPVLMDLWDSACGIRKPVARYTINVLAALAIAFLISFLGCLWLAWPAKTFPAGRLNVAGVRDAVRAAVTLSVNARSAGFPFEPMYEHSRPLQWFVMLVMFVGAGSAGTAGGLKVTTLDALVRGSVRTFRGEPPGRAMGFAVVWTIAFFGLVFVAMLSTLNSQAQLPGDRALFQTISAAANVGLTHEPLSVNATNAYTLGTSMLLGRLLPIGVLWWMAATATTTRDREDLVVG
jgi:trk system potassium uptake protein TrkH